MTAGFGFDPWMLALVAAGGFAAYTVIVEFGMSWTEGEASPALAAAFYSTIVVTAAFWALSLARGIPAGSLTVDRIWPFVLAGIAYPALFRFLYYEGIDRVGSSVSAAIMGGYPAVSVVLAMLLLGDDLSLVTGGGLVLIVGGVVLLQLTQETVEDDADIEDVVTEKLAGSSAVDLAYPAAAMVTTGGAFVLIDFGLTDFPDPVVATAVTQTPALLIFAGWAGYAGAASGQLNLGQAVLGAFVLAGGFNFVGWISQFFALQSGSVVEVVPLLNTMPLLILGITYGIERQIPRSPRILTAIVAIVAGATLVQIGL
jgi:drug/metabolite transporter (DMT)-like permease